MLIEVSLLLVAVVGGSADHPDSRSLIPAFARRYRVGCSHCHVAFPKLNGVGEAFRLNGYRFPEAQPEPRGEPTIPLGEEPWKDLWPRGVWPGELPASVPFALRIQSDVGVAPDTAGRTATSFRFPHDVELLAGASLGEHIGVFFEGGWNRDEGPKLEQAKITFQRLLASLGDRRLNLWIGLQNLFLLSFTNEETDRVARQTFLWQRFRPVEVPLGSGSGERLAQSEFRLGLTEPAIELNGLMTPRLYYAVGIAQGAGEATADNNRRKDVYYKLRYQAGGIALDGSLPPSDTASGPLPSAHRHLGERSVIFETFGYFGSEPTTTGVESRHRALGVSWRLIRGPGDFGVGYVWARDDQPWGAGAGALDRTSAFAKGEYLVYPWLIVSLKGEWFTLRTPPPGTGGGGGDRLRFTQTHLMPGLVALVRQNVRAVAEADLFPTYESPSRAAAPRGIWLRLDVAF